MVPQSAFIELIDAVRTLNVAASRLSRQQGVDIAEHCRVVEGHCKAALAGVDSVGERLAPEVLIPSEG